MNFIYEQFIVHGSYLIILFTLAITLFFIINIKYNIVTEIKITQYFV